MLLRFHGIPEELFGRGVLRKSRADEERQQGGGTHHPQHSSAATLGVHDMEVDADSNRSLSQSEGHAATQPRSCAPRLAASVLQATIQ
jgi:hypothetical protein